MKNRPTVLSAVVLLAFVGLSLSTGCASGKSNAPADKRQAKLAAADSAYFDGVAAEAAGDPAAAAKAYKAALRANAEHPGALRALATLYTNDERYADAIPLWTRLVDTTDGDVNAYNDLGYAYDLAGYPDPAEAAYTRGVQADPTNARIQTNFGLMLARHGRTNEAILHLRAAMPAADAYYNVAVVLESQGKKARAKREFQRALDADPDHVDAELHLAAIDYNE